MYIAIFMYIDAVLIDKIYLKGKNSKIWEAIRECIDLFIYPSIYLLNKYVLNANYTPTLRYWTWISEIPIRL